MKHLFALSALLLFSWAFSGSLQAQTPCCDVPVCKYLTGEKTAVAKAKVTPVAAATASGVPTTLQFFLTKGQSAKQQPGPVNCNPANCMPKDCNPANCKPADCKPAQCKPAQCKPAPGKAKRV